MRVGERRAIRRRHPRAKGPLCFKLTAYSLTLQIVSEMMDVALDSGIRP
jgi:hypothetical protein